MAVKMSRRRFDRSQPRPDIRANIEERDHLQQTLTELSVRAMGTNRTSSRADNAKNKKQILDVTEDLWYIQNLQEVLESPTSDDDVDLESIARTKQLLEERALEFKQRVKTCLLSYDSSSRKEALPYLRRIQTLYLTSNAAVNEILDQKSQFLQVAAKQSRTARVITRDVALGEFKKLGASVYELIGHTEGLDMEIIGATESSTTPGRHLRISGNFNEQKALKNALVATGLSVEDKSRGETPILVVRLSEPLKPGILRELKENFKREMATLEAKQIFSDIESSHDRILEMTREWQRRNEINPDAETLTSRDEIEYFLEQMLDGLDAEKAHIIQLKERLEAELPLSDLPVSEQTKALKTAKLIVKITEAQTIIIQTQLYTLRRKRENRGDNPNTQVRAGRNTVAPTEMRTAKAPRKVTFKDLERPNIRADVEERDRLEQDLTELSVRSMPVDSSGKAQNKAQILNVVQELYYVQHLQEELEFTASDEGVDLETLAFTQQIIEERAGEFKQTLQDCLLSYSGRAASKKLASQYLSKIQILYDASCARIQEIIGQKMQFLQTDQKVRKRATGVPSEVTRRDFEKLEAALNGSIGKHVENLTIELKDGTPSVPGQHIRISGDHDVQTALKNAIQAVGLTIEEEGGSTPIVVVRLTEPFDSALLIKIRENFQREMLKISSVMPDLLVETAGVMEPSYENGRIAWEYGVYQQELGNNEKAEELLLMAMFNGYGKAYTSLAMMALNYGNASLSKAFIDMGIGVEDPNAYKMLGVYNRVIRSGTIVEQPSSIGDELYEQAHLLQREGNQKEASKLYIRAAFMGNKKAYASIGLHLLTGIPGAVPVNKALAAKYFYMGVAAGHPRAMLNLAKMYEQGDGVAQSDETALGLYKGSFGRTDKKGDFKYSIEKLGSRMPLFSPNTLF